MGSWKMSKGMERMLRRMVAPNADLRYTAPEAMADPFWDYRRSSVTAHSMWFVGVWPILTDKNIFRAVF